MSQEEGGCGEETRSLPRTRQFEEIGVRQTEQAHKATPRYDESKGRMGKRETKDSIWQDFSSTIYATLLNRSLEPIEQEGSEACPPIFASYFTETAPRPL